MQQKETDLAGLRTADAKAYIAQYLTTLKLTEKKLAECAAEEVKWRGRVALARSKGVEDLAQEAEKQVERATEQKNSLSAEIAGLKSQIETMRKQLPGLAARERSVEQLYFVLSAASSVSSVALCSSSFKRRSVAARSSSPGG